MQAYSLSEGAAQEINTVIAKEADIGASVKERLQKFLKETTAAEIVAAKNAPIDELVKAYFEGTAPFEESGKKKNEFPDAIALLSLENWAKSEDKKILAVSADRGWKDYAAASDRIDIEEDLSAAFQLLQKDVRDAQKIVSDLLTSISSGASPSLLKEIDNAVQSEVGSLDPYIDASSYVGFEAELEELICDDFEFVADESGDYIFTITQIGVGKIVANVRVLVSARVAANFSFFVSDSEGDVGLGSESLEREAELDLAVLITFEGDFSVSPPVDITIADVSILEDRLTIDFGNIAPFENEGYEE